jgi:hypothetical protein
MQFCTPVAGTLAILGLFINAGGCSNKPSHIATAAWDPDAMAEQAMKDNDMDGNGKLSMAELDFAPGLKYNAKQLDTNGDGSLSHAEIVARISKYQEMQVALTSFTCNVTMGNRPLSGAKVRLVPEPFLEEVLKPVEGTSQKDGQADFRAEGISMSVVPVGMYRVEITSPNIQIPAKYNTNSTLGVEVSPIADPDHPGPPGFQLKQK